MRARTQRLDAALDALGRAEPVESVARHAELSPSFVRALVAAKPMDPGVALKALMAFEAVAASHHRRLRTALVWPGVTLVLVALASLVIANVAAPALTVPSGRTALGSALFYVPLLFAVVCFALLVVAVRGRWSLGFLTVWNSLDAWAFASSTVALVRGGAPLATAARASATVCGPRGQAAGLALARGLDAGAVTVEPVAPLLGELAARLLVTTVAAGAGVTTFEAYAELQQATLPHEVRRDAARLSAIGLLLSALALLATTVTFFNAYLRALDP